MKHNDILAENIKAYRKKNNLKQTELAKQLDVSRQVLSGYETGKSEPNLAFLIKLSNLMNCSIDSLLGLDENYILKFPFDTPNLPKQASPINTSDNIYELIKSLKYLIKKNQSTYKDLIMSKKRNDRALKELNMSKKRFDIMFDELNRTFNRENRFDELLKKLDYISDNIDYYKASNKETPLNISNNITEEVSNELVPEVDLNNSNYTYIDDEDDYADENVDEDEDTIDVHFLDLPIAAGEPIGYCDIDEESFKKLKVRYPLTKENVDEFYILTVRGNSMNKIVADGEDILIRSTNYVENGTIAAVNILDESECTLKYYYYDPETNLITLKPKSYEPYYEDIIFDANEHNVIVQGKYIGPVSDFL